MKPKLFYWRRCEKNDLHCENAVRQCKEAAEIEEQVMFFNISEGLISVTSFTTKRKAFSKRPQVTLPAARKDLSANPRGYISKQKLFNYDPKFYFTRDCQHLSRIFENRAGRLYFADKLPETTILNLIPSFHRAGFYPLCRDLLAELWFIW